MTNTILALLLLISLSALAGPPTAAPVTQEEFTVVNPSSQAALWATVFSPADASATRKYPAVVFIPGGLGFGSGMARGPMPRALAEAGFIVACFDPDGRGRSEGKENWNGKVHQDGLHAFLKQVASLPQVQKNNLGMFSSSFGLVMAAGALGRYPDDPPIKYFIDDEGPSDRFFITKFGDSHFGSIFPRGPNDEEWWAEREAVRSIQTVRCAYLRLQRERDHVHGENKQHALDMINAATSTRFGGKGQSPWTRLNEQENEPNRIYTNGVTPKWLPIHAGPPSPDETLKWLQEMSGRVVAAEPKTAGARAPGGERGLVQFRLNVNFFANEAEAQQNCRLLRRHLDLFKQAGVKASYWFTGLAAEQVQRLDPEFIRLLNKAGMPVAHHGANRPPKPMPVERVKGQNWQEDVQAILDYESFRVDPRTGKLDRTQVGGLKGTQQIFTNRIRITGRFFQASILYATKQSGCQGMLGLKDNTGAESNGAWFLGMKGMPDSQTVTADLLHQASRGEVDLFQRIEAAAAARPTNDVCLLAVVVHDFDFVRGSSQAQERLWECYAQLVRWAAKNPRLQIVSSEEILDRIVDDRSKTVSRAALLKAAATVAASPAAPPEYIDLGGDYLSLADTFQAFAQGLRAFASTGVLPEAVQTRDLLGPTQGCLSRLPAAATQALPAMSTADVVEAAKRVCAVMAQGIPAQVHIGSLQLNSAEFLLAMARTILAAGKGNQPEQLSLHSVEQLPSRVRANRLADPLTKLQFWTYKPERWKSAMTE